MARYDGGVDPSSALTSSVETQIAGHKLIPDGADVLVAVSGGVDSMVLLHLLARLAAPHRWRIIAAHFNHRLRGRESGGDERFVRRQCASLGIRIVVGSADVRKLAGQQHASIEMAARLARHQFLARTARSLRMRLIALAHHSDDQAELFCLRLLRGTGSEGLSGMKCLAPSPADPAVTLVRPLLHLSKAALVRFSHDEHIPFREDSTNTSPDHLRNRIRHDLLPRLRRDYQPAVDLTLARLMDIAGAEAEHMDAEAMLWLRADPAARAGFNDLSTALQRIIVRKQTIQCGTAPEFDLIENLRLHPGAWFTAPGNIRLRRAPDGLVSAAPASPASGPGWTTTRKSLRLSKTSGRVRFGSLSIQWKRMPHHPLPRHMPGVEFFDAARLGSQIILRHWQQGDRFQPIGMPRPVKLQDLFINARIPRELRHQLIVAESKSGDIFWVEGLRIGEIARVVESTRRMLRWETERARIKCPADSPGLQTNLAL